MRSLTDDIESLCIVKECRELEISYRTNFTDTILTDANNVSLRIIKKTIRGIDREKLVQKCSNKSPTIAAVVSKAGSWPKLWDSALHLGSRHTIGLQNLSSLMSHHGRGLHPCPLCDEQGFPTSVIDHILSAHHTEIGLNFNSTDQLLALLVDVDILFVYKFWKLLKKF